MTYQNLVAAALVAAKAAVAVAASQGAGIYIQRSTQVFSRLKKRLVFVPTLSIFSTLSFSFQLNALSVDKFIMKLSSCDSCCSNCPRCLFAQKNPG